jgi:IPT/TIG domain
VIAPRGSRVLSILLACLCVSAAFGVAGAGAKLTNVGYEGEPDFTCNAAEGQTTYAQTGVSGGTEYTIPADGAIVNWSLGAGTTPLPNPKLKVIRLGPGAGQFTVIGEAAAGTQTAKTATTFATLIPVKANDVLGFYPGSAGECLNDVPGNDSNEGLFALGDSPLNTPVAGTPYIEKRLPVRARLLPAPSIASVSPASGAAAGKTAVTINGEDLVQVKSVSFGGVPAESFKEESESQATAVAPAGAAGTVDVRVTTVAGESPISAGDKFTYVAPAPAGPSGPVNAAPNTSLKSTKIVKHKVTFKFGSNEGGSTFLCKLDKKAFAKCKSPKAYKNLKPGKHKFQVKASDAQGSLDPSPVVKKFTIKK